MAGPSETILLEARRQAAQMIDAMAAAERMIIDTIERECDALRAGQLLAADALHLRLTDAARLYLEASRALRASITIVRHVLPGALSTIEERRATFLSTLKVEFAVLAAERAATGRAMSGPLAEDSSSRAETVADVRPEFRRASSRTSAAVHPIHAARHRRAGRQR